MSRSYRNRKNNGIAFCRDRMKSSHRFEKRQSNKKMRKMEIINGNMYKKNGYTWDIHDYTFVVKIKKDWHKCLENPDKYWDYKYFMCK